MPELKKAPPEKTYRQILLDSRKEQLRLTLTAVERLRITFDAAVESLRQKIALIPDERIGTPFHRAMLQLQFEITDTMNALRADNRTLLDVGMVELAQNAADREVEVARLVEQPIDPRLLPDIDESFPLTNGQRIPVQFGRIALGAVERVSTRYYRDGLKLSERLHKLDIQGRKVIADTIVQGLAEQLSATDMSKRLQAAMGELAHDGLPPPRHVTMRIARTEISNAHREAHVSSTEQSPGILKDYISGVGWRLSLSHKQPDICDVWAAHDEGLGRGVYLPSDVPVDHPHGLCFTVSVLKAFPESGIGGKEPDTSKVPQSMVDYYARLGDKPAMAVVARRTVKPLTFATTNEASAWLTSRYPGMNVNLGEMDPRSASEVVTTMDDLLQRYPLDKAGERDRNPLRLEYGKLSGGTVASGHGDSYLEFSSDYFSNHDVLTRKLKELHESGWLVTDDLKGFVSHEFGHWVDYTHKYDVRRDGMNLADATELFRKESADLGKPSRYAETNGREAWAEAFAQRQTRPRTEWSEYTKSMDEWFARNPPNEWAAWKWNEQGEKEYL